MQSTRRLEQLKSARVAAVQAKKKRRCEINLVTDPAQLEIDNDKLSTTDISDTDGESGTWVWNESANEDDSDTEEGAEEEDNVDESESDLGIDEVKTKLKWNKEGEDKFRGAYGNGSRSTSKREQKSTRELEKQASQTYDIRALWQRNIEIGMASIANSQVGLGQVAESQPIDNLSPLSLSDLPRGSASLSNQQVLKTQRTEALKDLNRLLKLVTEQEKKYKARLSPHSNFYRRHLMVQQFLQSQLNSQSSPKRRDLSLNVARSFGKSRPTACNIVRWEKKWVEFQEIPERK